MIEYVKDMVPGQNFDRFECEVTAANPTTTSDKDGMTRTWQNLTVKDKNGETVLLVLWGVQCDEFIVGDNLALKLGYCKEYNGQRQISTGKIGLITRVRCEDKKPEVKVKKAKK
jgi:ssDNA-binding replication factor A large subunit